MADEKYKVVQLKATLKRLNLPQAGDKATLIKRLYTHDPSGAWKDIARSIQIEEETRNRQETVEDEDSDELARGTDGQAPPIRNMADEDNLIEMDEAMSLTRDLERMRRESELIRRQLEALRLERNRTVENLTPASVNSGSFSTPRPAITALAELLSEFVGAEDTFWNWQRQLELVRTTYNLDDNNTRILISMKLKQKALQWFHSKPEHLEMPITELIDRMKRMFDHRPAKMELRRRFEKRSWCNDESFSDYYYDKVILANRVPVEEDELIDFIIIDGIPLLKL